MCLLNWGQGTAPCADSLSFQVLNRKQRQMQFIERAQDAGQFGLVVNRAQHDGKRMISLCWRRRYDLHRTKTPVPVRTQITPGLDPLISRRGKMITLRHLILTGLITCAMSFLYLD